jgi:hypothetical protein
MVFNATFNNYRFDSTITGLTQQLQVLTVIEDERVNNTEANVFVYFE